MNAVLLLAYGTPERPEDVEAYFTHIRGGRTPSAAAVAGLRARYERVGGQTPLLRITRETAAALERELNASGEEPVRVYIGMKHWHPYTRDVMRQMRDDGVRHVVALALAPHYSRLSIGGYRKGVEEAQEELGRPFTIEFVESWHLQTEFLDLIADHVRSALDAFGADRDKVMTVFTAHSLPVRIREWNDPYESQLQASCEAVAARVGLAQWSRAWQSAGHTGEPWLGPDVQDYLETLHAAGHRHVLQVPIGFVSDHLEILFDIDIEAQEKAATLGMTLRRTALPNATPAFIRTLAAVVHGATRPLEVSTKSQ